jgi:hypothetical protein
MYGNLPHVSTQLYGIRVYLTWDDISGAAPRKEKASTDRAADLGKQVCATLA